MAILTLTVQQYLDRGRVPFAPGDTVTIADTVENLNGLSAEQIGWMRQDNVDFLGSTGSSAADPLIFDVAKFRAMGTSLRVLSGDHVNLVDAANSINSLDIAEFQRLAESFDLIDATGDNAELRINGFKAQSLLSSRLVMAANDVVKLEALNSFDSFVNNPDTLRALIAKNVDVFGGGGFALVNVSLASALIIAESESASLDPRLFATVTVADVSTLSAQAISQFGAKNVDYLSSGSNALILHADQAAALAETASLACVSFWQRPDTCAGDRPGYGRQSRGPFGAAYRGSG